MKFKVYGEARTGTTYLERVIQQNTDWKLRTSDVNPGRWKHGLPRYYNDTVFLFLMRDPYEWMRSMLTEFDSRWNGYNEPFGNIEGKDVSYWGRWDHPLHARTIKYKSYLGFLEKHGGHLIKTEYMKEHPSVLERIIGEFDDIETHIRLGIPGRDDPDRQRLTPAHTEFIKANTDTELEAFIQTLTYERY